jgi:hypothetical protein
MKTHVHEWVYLGDLALLVGKRESEVALRRAEYCVGCSTLRVEFPSGWYDMRGSATDNYLKEFDGEKAGTVHKIAPLKFKPRPPHTKASRLGTTLNELYERSLPVQLPFKK